MDEHNNNSLNLSEDTAAIHTKYGLKDGDTTAKGLDAMDDNNQQNILSRRVKLNICYKQNF